MSLALKFKLALREHWDAPTCPALKALQGLGDTLGVIVKCQPEWPIIVSELRPAYDERGVDLVASVAGLVRGVCEAVEELVDGGGGDETWGDTLLEKLGESFRTLKIFPEVSSGSLDRPQAKWDDERGGIILDLPKSAIATPLEFIPIFKEELRTAFDKKPTSSQVLDEEDAVIIDSATTPLKDLSINTQSRSLVQYLPDASLIPRPDELLQRPPYILHVRASGDHRVDIECTHSPSLQVLATYLQRWCRTNHNLSTKPPVVDVRLEQGSFGAGLLHDVLTIGADQGRFHVSPTLVLHLVESVLGYERVHTDICSWQFRRDTPFKAV